MPNFEPNSEGVYHETQRTNPIRRPEVQRRGRPVLVIKSPQSTNGIGSSIASGVRASTESDGWLIALADMPYIQSRIMHKITQCLTKEIPIVRPVFQGKQGHPVGFKSTFRTDLLRLTGDKGAKQIISKHTSQIHFIAVSEPSVCMDIDTPQDLLSMAQSIGS